MKIIAAYYEHLRHLRELIMKEMSSKTAQMKVDSSFKPCPSSSATTSTDPGPPEHLSSNSFGLMTFSCV
jgi:hypothetical protein